MNQHDSGRIAGVLEAAGHRRADVLEQADLVVLNACSVREKAEQKLRSEVGRLGKRKSVRPELVIVVAGCVAQQEGQRLIDTLPQIDIVIGPDNAPDLPQLLREVEGGAPPQVRTQFDLEAPRFLPAAPESRAVTAYVTTMKGCDERCTFCVVPTTRGPERYRPSEEVLSEIEGLVAAGTREVTLLGQTVDSYLDPTGRLTGGSPQAPAQPVQLRAHRRKTDESQFPLLLRAIAARCPQLARLRYTSPHPRHLTPGLVAAHRDLPVLCRHVHMPVQSGSDPVLKRMLRRYSVEEYVERVRGLQQAVPGLTLSTDIIVGFPGETEADFEKTLDLVRELQFVGVFGFKYSQRPFTPALRLQDDVSEAAKSERLERLFELTGALLSGHLEALVGTYQQVLVEGRDRRGSLTGRTERNEIVHLAASTKAVGRIVDVRIERAFKHSLWATPCDPELVQPTPALEGSSGRALPVVA